MNDDKILIILISITIGMYSIYYYYNIYQNLKKIYYKIEMDPEFDHKCYEEAYIFWNKAMSLLKKDIERNPTHVTNFDETYLRLFNLLNDYDTFLYKYNDEILEIIKKIIENI